MLSDYDTPYTTYEHKGEAYRILHFKNLDLQIFDPKTYPQGVFSVETYYDREGNWDTASGASAFKTFEEADHYIQTKEGLI